MQAAKQQKSPVLLNNDVEIELSRWLPIGSVVFLVFCKLAQKLKWKVDDAKTVVQDFLLADGLMQCQLVVDVDVLGMERPPSDFKGYHYRKSLEHLPEKQHELLRLHLERVFGKRPGSTDIEYWIANGTYSAQTWQPFQPPVYFDFFFFFSSHSLRLTRLKQPRGRAPERADVSLDQRKRQLASPLEVLSCDCVCMCVCCLLWCV
jgi:hypothetical protein